MSPVGGGSVAGTTGRGLPMEALEAQLGWYGHSGSIELRGHVSNCRMAAVVCGALWNDW